MEDNCIYATSGDLWEHETLNEAKLMELRGWRTARGKGPSLIKAFLSLGLCQVLYVYYLILDNNSIGYIDFHLQIK